MDSQLPSGINKEAWENLNAEIISCRRCPRLVAWREEVGRVKRRAYRDWAYWAKPVPGFGDQDGRVFVVGLAPGAHGSNRTGRMFTGDSAGNFLYSALHRAGFANLPASHDRQDGLELNDLFITAVCRCAPPDNKPEKSEIENCRSFLLSEMALFKNTRVIVALGKLAFDQLLGIYRKNGITLPVLEFGHAAAYRLGENLPWLLASYHPSQQNTQTGRLTVEMFDQIWRKVHDFL